MKTIQKEHRIWDEANFGVQDLEVYELGMIEEVGELAHAVLKRKQGIRNSEDHDANIKDAVADIGIYLIGYCTEVGLDFYDLSVECEPKIGSRVQDISNNIVDLIGWQGGSEIKELIGSLESFSIQEGFTFGYVIRETWDNVVSKRDWKINPDMKVESK